MVLSIDLRADANRFLEEKKKMLMVMKGYLSLSSGGGVCWGGWGGNYVTNLL